MRLCPSCQHANPDDSAFCSACGGSVVIPEANAQATVLMPSSAPGSNPSSDVARFVPGAMIAGRYRIVGILGRGGMGEVYRADDMKLGQSVALKFLPLGVDRDPDRLARFVDEARTARQVTHANVCRVYDIGDFDGQHFLSMEYVDGEDLSSLLRRIGRLPEERAVEVARQICAGLAAVHEVGLLHRDLKPANVMLDGRGRVRLTDFGLASLAESADGDGIGGTPAYMAPEQSLSGGASVQSDLYALGLVLHELFTGRAVFEAETLADLRSMHASSAPSRPSRYVETLDPAVERVVLRCLEKDPAERPVSALAVSAGLPGGDPLQAALAAGETPSPELVAESGEREGTTFGRAALLALVAFALFVGAAAWTARLSLIEYVPFEKRPAVLQDRALDLVSELGYVEDVYARPVDQAWGWLLWTDVMREVAELDSTAARWEPLRQRPDVAGYWYRQSPRTLSPEAVNDGPVLVREAVTITNPPMVSAGEIAVLLDLDGTLRRFEATPRRFSEEPPSEPDWDPLFRAARLDRSQMREVEPRYQRFMSPDLRRAWVGTSANRPGIEYRIEAGASEGRPVLFNVATAASMEGLARPPRADRSDFLPSLVRTLPSTIPLFLMALVIVLTSRNLQNRRADQRGARRFATAVYAIFVLGSVMRSHTLFSWAWAGEFWLILAGAMFPAGIVWAMYLAAEPVGRQVWPTMFISSNRLLSRPRMVWRDPVIGRSVLVGVFSGALIFLLAHPLWQTIRLGLDPAASWPFWLNLDALRGGRYALGELLDFGFRLPLAYFHVATLIVLQRWVRRRWLAVGLTVVLWAMMGNANSWIGFANLGLLSIGYIVVLLRAGVVALVIAELSYQFVWDARAVDYAHWTSDGARMTVVLVVALLVYGVWASTRRSHARAG